MSIEVRTILEPQGPATAIELDDEQVAQLGGGKRAAVTVTVGERTARLRLAVMGGKNLIGLSKAARAELGVEIGDAIEASIELDLAERVVDLPEDLAAALDAEPSLRQAFDRLPPSRRKESARSVEEAKRPETRARRIATVLDRLRQSQD
ncbi:YdeI/OmpD-associated family protein [Leucobacter sp. GX24907]